MKSAYFPNSVDSLVKENLKDKSLEDKNSFDRYNNIKSTVHTMSGISFPFNQTVLWNREPITYPIFMNSNEIVRESIQRFLDNLCSISLSKDN